MWTKGHLRHQSLIEKRRSLNSMKSCGAGCTVIVFAAIISMVMIMATNSFVIRPVPWSSKRTFFPRSMDRIGERCLGTALSGSYELPSGARAACSTALFMGTNRRSRRQEKKEVQKTRDQKFFDAVLEADEKAAANGTKSISGVEIADRTKQNGTSTSTRKSISAKESEDMYAIEETPVAPAPSVTDASKSFDEQPELSTVVVDEDTGFQRIAQGKAVMDVVTRKAVKLSDAGPQYRLAQFSPGVPPHVRDRYRLDTVWDTITVPDIVTKFKEAAQIDFRNETTGEIIIDIPPHPAVANTALDFVLANRDLLGTRMKKVLGRLKLKAQSEGKLEEAGHYRKLWKHFMTIENHISAPFRQMIMDAESKIGPQFGNLDLKTYAGGHLYERCAAYVVLKGMVAHWEKKYADAQYVEGTPQTSENFMTVLGTGDPKRYLPNSPIIYKLEECTKICAMAQRMSAAFVNNTALFDDLPVELLFVEAALNIQGGTELRRFMYQDFCPAVNVQAPALREGVWRLYAQLCNMQIDPYGELTNVVGRMAEALTVGTDEEHDPYRDYLYNFDANGPGYFQTYTFQEEGNSLIRFLDGSRRMSEDSLSSPVGTVDDVVGQLGTELQGMFGSKKRPSAARNAATTKERFEEIYSAPEKRAVGRPHELGWLNWLDEDKEENENIYESDNWREVNSDT